MGYAWQRGLVPLGLAAMQRAIELNGVAVDNNLKAFSLGRLAAADPVACREMLHEPDPSTLHADTVDELVERGVRHLTAYQDARYAERYRALVAATRAAESALPGASAADAR
jgi:indolepyruvate ferredoxin oxidoreductase